MTQPFRAPNGFARSSQTSRVLDSMDGYHLLDEPDDRPMPEPEQLRAVAKALIAALTDNLTDTSLEPELEDIAWSLVDILHRKGDRLQRTLDSAELRIKDAHDQQDGSEVMSVELERTIEKGRVFEARRDAIETLRDNTSEEFEATFGSEWRPRTRSKVNHRNMTASMIAGRDFINAKRYAETHVLLPKGPVIVFSGGVEFDDVNRIHSVLNKTLDKHPSMVLAHTGKNRGADKIASSWAKAHNVADIAFGLGGYDANDRSAGFKRNQRLLETNPIGVIVFPGPGTVQNVATTARKMGLAVLDLTGADQPRAA